MQNSRHGAPKPLTQALRRGASGTPRGLRVRSGRIGSTRRNTPYVRLTAGTRAQDAIASGDRGVVRRTRVPTLGAGRASRGCSRTAMASIPTRTRRASLEAGRRGACSGPSYARRRASISATFHQPRSLAEERQTNRASQRATRRAAADGSLGEFKHEPRNRRQLRTAPWMLHAGA